MRFVFSLIFCFICADIAEAQFTFFDDFTRGATNNPLSPWTVGIGIWNVTNGVLRGTGSAAQDYSDAYVPGTWTNFTIQGQIQLPNPSWACGFSGRINPSNGARYVANVYPEWSPLGPGSYLRLIKFHAWRVWSSTFTPMALVPLPGVGTNVHNLKMVFQSNQISVYYDGLQVVQMLDTNVDGLAPFNSGAAGAHMYLGDTPYYAFFDNVSITPLPANSPPLLPSQTNRIISTLVTMTVTNTATDQDYPPNPMTYSLTGPAGATIDTNGVITWTPTVAQDLTTNVLTIVATDFNSSAPPALQHLSATNSFTVIVNSKAIVVADTTTVVSENCSPTNNAVDPGETVTVSFALKDVGFGNSTNLVATLLTTNGVSSPSGPQSYGVLTSGGASGSRSFSFTASGVCGGNVNPTFQLQDGSYNLGFATFTIPFGQFATVYTQNFDSVSAPALPSGWTTSASGAQANWVTQTATNNTAPNAAFTADAGNIGNNELVSQTYALPGGVSQLSFSHYYDLEVNTATEGFDGGVLEIKIGTNAFIDILAAGGTFGANGYDHTISSIFGNPLAGRQAWSGTSPGFITTLVNLPASAANQNVQFKWRCGTDNGNGLSGWRVDSVGIKGRVCCNPGAVPVIVADTSSLTAESCAPTNNAIDPGEAITVLFGLKDVGVVNTTNLVATLLSTNGVTSPSSPQTYGILSAGGSTVSQPFSFTASASCGGTVTATFQLQDGVLNLGTVSFPFTIGQLGTVFTQNFDSVIAPALPSGWSTSATGVQSNWATQAGTNNSSPNTAFSADPVNVGVNELVTPGIVLPGGASQLSFSHYYDLEPHDNVEGFDGGVLEIKIGTNAFTDILSAGGSFASNGYDHTISTNFSNPLGGRQAWSGTSPGFVKSVVNLPPAAAGQSIQFRWRCGTDNSNGRTGWRVDSVGITGRTCCAGSTNLAPSLPAQSDRTIAELTTVTVTNTASDADTPANLLTYSLQNPPAGASISTNGIITWTPSEAQGPSTNTITTIVADNTLLSATNSFKVIVTEVNNAPSLSAQTNRTIAELTAFVVTNTASDSDIPANVITYSLQNPPAGATISTNGVINWTPSEAQGPGTNTITTIVSDNGVPPLSATNSFNVVVTEVNSAPVLPNQTNRTIAELTALTVTNTASDSDIPANALAYSLQNPPAGANIDTNGVITWTPTEAQAASTNTITTVVTDNGVPTLSATNSFTVVVNEVNTAPSLSAQTNRTIAELTTLTVTNSASDSDIPANMLSYSLQSPPGGATISTNGVIIWTPSEAQGPSTNTITTVVTDNGVPPLSATNSFSVVVTEVNSAPSLPAQTNRTIAELTTLTVTNTATDPDLPANVLTYTLQNPPAGLTIDTNGVITWTPTETQSPSTNTVTTIVTDNGVPPLSATNSFTVVVTEANSVPALPVQTNRTIAELTTLTVTNTGSDSDMPANTLSYSLQNPPAGATIATNGVITWTPTEAQGPSTNTLTTVVTDNGVPPLSATNSFTVVVTEVNSAPSLPAQTNRTIAELTALVVTNTGSDTDLPANVLSYALQNAPAGAGIDTNGVITWTPSEAQGPGTNTLTTVVTDNGVPPLSATNSFTVVVTEMNSAPSLPAQTNRTVAELTALVVTNKALDTDIPTNTLSYTLQNPPAGATISSNGVISWSPTEAQGPSTNTIITVVTDSGVPPLSATNSFTVVVSEVNSAPTLPGQTNRTIAELTTLTVTNAASDSDIPANALSYTLQNAPTGATIDTNGVINWTPTDAQGPSTNTIVTVVTDNGVPPLSATNSFTVVVIEVNGAPSLPVQTNRTIAELTSLIVTNTALDTDVPANVLTYSLQNPPSGATISSNGVINWTPTEAQGPGTNIITTVVTDNGVPTLSATNSFTVVVTEVNTAPVLPVQTNRTITELTTLVVTNTATDSDIPTNTLSYALQNPPAGITINTNGVISWTPTAAQGPSTNTITTVVTDNGVPPLSATNNFTVVVTEVNTAPTLPNQTNHTIAELTTLTVTNTATDSDLPPNVLSYALQNAPAGATISTNGVITWTPSEAQGPGTNTLTTVVTDNGVPPLSATNSFTVVVTEVNSAPSLPNQTNRTIAELMALVVTNTATDSDLPANGLNYILQNPPAGATIDTNGVITWIPDEAQGPSTNTITTVVTDNGSPPLSGTNSFTVVVTEVNTAPTLSNQTNHTIAELTTLVVTNNATDTDIPANLLSYVLQNPPAGATIDTNGVITWTPDEARGPSTNTIVTVVTDNGLPPLSATNSFIVVVTEMNTAPSLPGQTNHTIAELTTLIVTNTATDADLPPNILTYVLENPPTGATISSNGVIHWTPDEAQGPSTNVITTIVTDDGVPALSATNIFAVFVTDVNSAPVLPAQNNRTIAESATLVVTNTASDSDIPANALTYALESAPTGASIDTNGIIFWTPTEAQGPSTNTVTTIVTDNGVPPLSATNSFLVVVAEVNTAPSLPAQTNYTITEMTEIVVTNTAADADMPPNHLSYSLEAPPAGMTIDTNGVITWTPSEAQGPSTNIITTIVVDDGAPPLSQTNTFTIVVNEINSPPVLPAATNYTIGGIAPFVLTNTAFDPDIPANNLAYFLTTAPTNATIDANGVIRWTPTLEQVPGTNFFETVVTDDNPWAINEQHFSATNIFTVTVTEVHNGPLLAAQPERTVNELTELVLTNQAADYDVPTTVLTYELIDPPAGAAIDTNGVITWTPTEAQGPSTNVITTVVRDNAEPPLSGTNSITVIVAEVNTAPSLPIQTNYTISAISTLIVTNAGSDSDIPANALSYALLEGPTNATISPEGVITWSPVPAQVPSTNTITTVVTDSNPSAVNSKHLFATNSFLVTVTAIHDGPSLGAQSDRTINELTLMTVTNAANDSDIPALPLTYELVNPPVGATIGTNGIITWTPDEGQGPSTNEFVTVVSDNGIPPLSATNSFIVMVNEVNSAPVLPLQTNRTLNGLTTLAITNTATDSDLPSNTLTYALLTAPTNAVIDAEGVITWTPSLEQIPGTNVFETVVTDDNLFAVNSQHLSATNSFAVITELHNAPSLAPQPDVSINELSELTVTNGASALNLPVLNFSYQLINPPAGASIDTNGVITWTPTEAQGPSTNTITTLATDNGNPPLMASNSFTVVVHELNTPPVLPIQNDRTIVGLATLTVTNTAADGDIPANPLSYSLLTAPTSAVIDANGVIAWTPQMSQVPSTNVFETVVTDFNASAVNAQHLSATNQFTVVVQAVHTAPVLPSQSNRTILELTTLLVTNMATEDDIPPLPLSYSLSAAPAGVTIDTNGVIVWTPSTSQCPTTNLITTIVTDGGGIAGLSATNSFFVVVQPQIITIQSIRVSNHIATITWSTVLSQKYRLQYKDSPLQTNWTDLLPDIKASGPTASTTNGINSSNQRFYRVYLVP